MAPNFWQDIRRGSQTFGKTFGVEATKRRGRSNPLPTVGVDGPLGPLAGKARATGKLVSWVSDVG